MKMTFSPLENSLLMEMANRPHAIVNLYERYVTGRRCSRAGFYKAVSSLKKKEVITEKSRVISINKIWVAESYVFFKSLVKQKATPSYLAKEVAQLKEGDNLTYTFRSIADIDIFILNILYDLLLLKVGSSILILEPHEFFVLFNNVRTAHILREIESIRGSVFLLIESTRALDKEVVKFHLGKPAKGHVSNKTTKSMSRVSHVIGHICIELHLDKSFANAIDQVFLKHTEVSEELVEHLKHLAHKRQKHKIVIYKSAEKAQKTKSKFRKYFLKV